MDGEILDVVTEWSTHSVSDGVSGLYELADGDFSGAVTDGTAWAFVLNGRFVGVFDGSIDDFEEAPLTAHMAPDMSLPLLYAMQAGDTEVRAKYYSNDAPLPETDDTLSSGNFVGYVELSENVLSGDYYVVYYGGRALPVAYVGNNRRLVTGDEAFDLAADEVGIYSVVDADIEVVDLPERPASSPEPTETGTTVPVASDGESGAESDIPDDAGSDEAATTDANAVESAPDVSDSADGETDAGADADDAGTDSDTDDTEFGALGAMSGVEAETDAEAETAAEPETATESTADVSFEGASADDPDTEDTAIVDDDAPSESADVDDTEPSESADVDDTEPSERDDVDAEDAHLRRELDAASEAKAELEAERDRIASERDDLRAEAERLRERVAELEAELDRREAADAAPERTLDPDEALAGTNLFVRYEDKAAGTLARAAEGRISPAELRENLRLEYHTEFESENASVDGQPFEDFLRGTPEHRFAMWLLLSLTTEIRQADARAELMKLYEAIEDIDRVDLDGSVDVTVEDADGEATGESATESFDVVFRNKMGDPLFVAGFDDSRDPTHAPPIRSLVGGARAVSEAVPSFAAAFAVTTSFFDADAMEVAVDATRGGLFSRSSRRSYVKLSRKAGFHLCLVEARDGDFFLTDPEL